MDPNWLWLVPVVGFFVFEIWGLRTEDDKMQPLTYWIRKQFKIEGTMKDKVHSIGWWLGAGVLGWLAYHFLVEAA